MAELREIVTRLPRRKPLPKRATPAGLTRVLRVRDLLTLGLGAIVGTGVFVMTGLVVSQAGPGSLVSLVVLGSWAGAAVSVHVTRQRKRRLSSRMQPARQSLRYKDAIAIAPPELARPDQVFPDEGRLRKRARRSGSDRRRHPAPAPISVPMKKWAIRSP
jgi:hypothetical protein